MMKSTILFLILLTNLVTIVKGQVPLLEDTLIKKSRYNDSDGKIKTVKYVDYRSTFSIDSLPKVIGTEEAPVELCGMELDTYDKLYALAYDLFTLEEIRYLDENRCYIYCIVHSSGKIASVSFLFFNHDPTVTIKQLVAFSRLIRENLSFHVCIDGNIQQEGYFTWSFPAFQALLRPGSLISGKGRICPNPFLG